MIRARFRLDWPGFALDTDLQLPARGVTAILGQSGCGKTTLLRCMAGLERAPLGEMRLGEEIWQSGKVWLPTHKRALGYVFQEASLFAHLSVLGNLRYGLRRVAGADGATLDKAIELLGIGHLLPRRPERLSGGERSRVGIARALATNPKLLLMDEPLAALDEARKREVLPYLQALHREWEIPVLYVSHSLDEVSRLADHVVMLHEGRVQACGPLLETITRLDLPLRAGEEPSAIIDARVAAIDARWHLARLDFDGGELWVRDHGLALEQPARVRVLARDVSVACEPPRASSINNVLPAHIDGIAPDDHPAMALLRLRVGRTMMLARITRRAVATLQLETGQPVWAQIKSAALIE
jgi:molybdate transport system ATP-binding protein